MSTQTEKLPTSPDQLAYELMNRTFEDITKAHLSREKFFNHYFPIYQARSNEIIHKCKNGDLVRKVRFFINWQTSQHRKIEVIGEETLENPVWKLEFIHKPGDIKTLQNLYFTPLGNPDLHSSWIVLSQFLDENFEPINPLFSILGSTVVRNFNG